MPTYSAPANVLFSVATWPKTLTTYIVTPNATTGRTSQGMKYIAGLQRNTIWRSQGSTVTMAQLIRNSAVASPLVSATIGRGGTGTTVTPRPSVGLLWPRPARTTTAA